MPPRLRVMASGLLALLALFLGLLGAVLALGISDLAVMAAGVRFPSPRSVGVVLLIVTGGSAVGWGIRRRRRTGRWGRLPVAGAAALALACGVLVFRLGEGSARDVEFPSAGVSLSGTLHVPPGKSGPLPAVAIVPGSAPFGRGFYQPWVEALVDGGFVVLVPDKRGVGRSGGHYESENNASLENLELLGQDAVAAVRFLATLPEVDARRIGLVGLSQAGWTIPIAATLDTQVAYFAIVSGPTVSVREENAWSRLRGEGHTAASADQDAARAILDTTSPGGVDARPLLQEVVVPGLWLFGDQDASVPSEKSIAVLEQFRRAGKPFEHRSFPDRGHLILGREPLPLVPGLRGLPRVSRPSLDSLVAWLRRTASSES